MAARWGGHTVGQSDQSGVLEVVRTQATTGGGGSSEGRCRGVGCGTGLASSHGGVPNQLSDGRGSPPRVDCRQGPGLGRRQDALGPVSWLEARTSLQSREGRGRAAGSEQCGPGVLQRSQGRTQLWAFHGRGYSQGRG